MKSLKQPLKPRVSRRAALEELARRKGLLAEPGTFPIGSLLFDKQAAFINESSPFKTAVCSRRAGKSTAVAADLVNTAHSFPDSTALYITGTRADAKKIIWAEVLKFNQRYQLGGVPNISELTLSFPNGSIVRLAGAKDESDIAKLRGQLPPVRRAYIDEAQSIRDRILKILIDDILEAALLDYAGDLVVIGTPSAIPSGYFYNISHNLDEEGKPLKESVWAIHEWTFFDNPYIPIKSGKTHEALLQRVLRRRGVTISDPSIQREYFGKWVTDENSLVYHWSRAANHYDQLPEGSWHYLVGLDLGFKDADAIAVLAYNSDASPSTYLVDEVVTKGQDISALVAQVDTICKKYPVDKIVVDAGGLGKKITEEISKRFSVPMVAAEKTRKMEYIELLNDSLRTGRLMARATSQFAMDSLKVEWDHDKSTPDKKIVSDRFHSDICDAVLYAWRESYSYTHQAVKPEPEYGTRAWSDAESDKMFQADLDRLEQAKTVEDELRERYEPEINLDNLQRLDRPRLRYQARFDKRRKL